MSKNVGKLFEAETRAFLEGECMVAIRLPDILIHGVTTRKPFDFCGCDSEGYFVAIECKATRKKVFSFSRIEDHQAEALSLVASTEHGKAYLALNFRDERGPGQAYLISWGWLEIFLSSWSKKSIRRAEALTQFQEFRLTRITGGWEKQGPHLI